MSSHIAGAIKAPWREDCGLARLFLGGLCMIIPILCFVPIGYNSEYLNKMMNGKDYLGNIFQNGSKSFVIGAKKFIGEFLLIIPFLLIGYILTMILHNTPIVYIITRILLNILCACITFIMYISFACDFKILSMVDFGRAYNIAKESPKKLLIMLIQLSIIYIIYGMLILIASLIATLIPIIGKIIAIVFLPSLFFAIFISTNNLIGQFSGKSAYIQSIKQDLA